LIVGGGIVGAGIARDAALRGLKVALVEQRDFASGTSSRSSRLLHGGIRYLAQGRIGLVREANREKTVVQEIAPHLCEPLAFIFPTRHGTPWKQWKLSIGVKLYDLLCGRRNLGRSESLSIAKTLSLLPGLAQPGLTGSVRYFDGLTNDARLVIDTLRSAAAAGGQLYNYVTFAGATQQGDLWQATLRDTESDEEQTITTRTLVNAAGPWSDRIPGSKTTLRVTKGIHLVVDRSRLPIPDAVVNPEGDRILFAIPWGERVILGTTDTDYDGPLENPPCLKEDVDYVLRVTNDAFPSAALTYDDVISTWSGLRPLVADPHGKPSDISRRHHIEMSHPGWWDVTGGKLTTYRLMAEETVDAVAEFLGGTRYPCTTARAELLPRGVLHSSGLLPPVPSQELVDHYCQQEWARHLDDVMVRRTSLRYYHRDHRQLARQVANWMAGPLDWSEATKREQLDRYDQLTTDHFR
jgi:glycerol-3-phosphate dehydrogenase